MREDAMDWERPDSAEEFEAPLRSIGEKQHVLWSLLDAVELAYSKGS